MRYNPLVCWGFNQCRSPNVESSAPTHPRQKQKRPPPLLWSEYPSEWSLLLFCDTKHSNTQPACSSSSIISSLWCCIVVCTKERERGIVFLCRSHAKKVIYTRMTIYLRHEGGENLTLFRHNSMTEQLWLFAWRRLCATHPRWISLSLLVVCMVGFSFRCCSWNNHQPRAQVMTFN